MRETETCSRKQEFRIANSKKNCPTRKTDNEGFKIVGIFCTCKHHILR